MNGEFDQLQPETIQLIFKAISILPHNKKILLFLRDILQWQQRAP